MAVLLLSAAAGGCAESGSKAARPTIKVPTTRPKELVIAGSGANIQIIRKLAQAYQLKHPDAKIEIPNTIGSTGAISGVSKGEIELGLISRDLHQWERSPALRLVPYGIVGLIIGVHPTVPDNNITYQDYVNIIKGQKTKWLDGNDIVVLIREKGDSTTMVAEEQMPGLMEANDEAIKKGRWKMFTSDPRMEEALQNTPYGLGFTNTGSLLMNNQYIKPLRINGVEPTIANIKNGSYKLVKVNSFVYREPLTKRAASFINFVFTPEGRKILAENGYIPLDGN